MIGFSRFNLSLWTALPTAVLLIPLLLTAAACSLLGGGDPRWDTDVPDSAPVEAKTGTWGPEGRRIAFIHTPDTVDLLQPGSRNQLWTLDLRTRQMRRVMRGPVLTPDWHPDGSRFAFHSGRIPQHLFTVGAEGPPIRRLTGPGSPNPELENTVVGRWRPDGEQILYAVEAGEPRGVSLMDPDGSNARIIIEYGVMPAWFPDGERIAYVNWDQSVEDGSRKKQIYVARADGTGRRKLTDLNPSRDLAAPTVSPDGEQIAFAYNDQIYLMNADGTEIRQVTGGEGDAAQPMWSPDGERILFFRRFFPGDGRSTTRLFLLDVETLEVEPVFPAKE